MKRSVRENVCPVQTDQGLCLRSVLMSEPWFCSVGSACVAPSTVCLASSRDCPACHELCIQCFFSPDSRSLLQQGSPEP